MKYNIIKYGLFALIAASFQLTGCKKDYKNPAAVPVDEVFSDARATTNAAIGIQRRYSVGRASSLYNMVTANGFVTRELILRNAGNVAEAQFNTGGGTVDGTNTILDGLWINCNKIVFDADQVITSARKLGDKNYASGLIGYVTIFKAMSIGNMAMFWEKVPIGIGQNIAFEDRVQGFNRVVRIIDTALNDITANPISSQLINAIPAGVDIVNSLHALKARYALCAGNYAAALSAANAVDTTKRSVMNFDNANLNPIFETATSTNNVFQPVDSSLGLPVGIQPDLTDRRVPFYTTLVTTSIPRYRINGFGASSTTAFPIYWPGEVTLIKAECYVRQPVPDLTNALTELNKVVTKTTDPLGVGAALTSIPGPLTDTDLLLQIYRNRCIELFMSGLKLEDMRRFARPLSERKRNFMPYPFRERDNNSNTPADPAG